MDKYLLFLAAFAILLTGEAFGRADGETARVFGGGGAEDDGPEYPVPTPGAQETLYGIYRPWTGVLLDLKSHIRSDRNYVFWVMVPPQHPLDLRNADGFRKWMIATPPAEMSISHNMVAWRCRAADGRMVEGATGMTGEGSDQASKLIHRGFGLSSFLAVFTDGYLNPSWEVDQYVKKHLEKRGAVFSGFEVSEENCANMDAFVHEFVLHPAEPFKRFGLLPSPDRMEGGGCVTFASELLKRAGVLETVIPSFYREIRAREDLMGGNLERLPVQVELPEMPWLGGRARSISLRKLMTSAWERRGAKMQTLRLMDPEKMIYALKTFADEYLSRLPADERAREELAFRSSPLGERRTVGKRILRKPTSTLINEQFEGMKETRDLSRAWLQAKIGEGFRLRRTQVVGMPVFVLERGP